MKIRFEVLFKVVNVSEEEVEGHSWTQIWENWQRRGKISRYQPNAAAKQNIAINVANLCNNVEGKVTFVFDSGAGNHFVQESLEVYMQTRH